MLRIQKRLSVTARQAHVLLYEILVHGLSWLEVYKDPGAGSFGLLFSGTDGETNSALPTTFTAASGAFTGALVGKYLVLGGASTPMSMRGVHKIVAVPSATTVIVSSGLYGSTFSTTLNTPWRIVDPTLNTDATEFVVQAPAGTATPAWQAKFYLNALDVGLMRIEVGPWGGYSAGVWTMPATASVTVNEDVTPVWYFFVDDEVVKMFTEDAAGTAVFNIGYAGSGVPSNPAIDDHFAVAAGGTPVAFNTVQSIGADDSTQVVYTPVSLRPDGNAITLALPNSPYDLRRDLIDVPLACSAPGFEEMDRGTLRGVKAVSTLIGYRTFVDNGRSWLSLGSGLAFAWDGSVSP